MAHSKKSRKPGSIGVAKSHNSKPTRSKNAPKVKKPKGNQPGSRHSVAQHQQTNVSQGKTDPRIGSKKKIDLTPKQASAPKPVKPKYATPAQELAALEADQRLSTLLDQFDSGKVLNNDDQQYLDNCMSRHQILCDLLGINNDAEDKDTNLDDPFAQFDAIDINDFR